MLTKSQILNSPRSYSSEQIAEAINAGVISMYELSKSGNLTPLMRKRIQTVLDLGVTTPQQEKQETKEETTPLSENAKDVAKVHDHEDDEFPSNVILTDDASEESIPSVNFEHQVLNENIEKTIKNKSMFRHPFSFKGRIRRTEYWISTFIYLVWYAFLEFSAIMVEQSDKNMPLFLIALVLTIPAIWFMWAQGAKRCHDRGNSGWYQLIPFYGFWMLFAGSEDGDNEYGENPKD